MYQNNTQTLLNKLEFLKKINFNNLLDGTQKTLNVINQAIPIFYQVKPLINNTKTLFQLTKIMNEPEKEITKDEPKEEIKKELKTNPIFYI